jgi:hypothetical protein
MVTSVLLFVIALEIFLAPFSATLIIVYHKRITADMREAIENAGKHILHGCHTALVYGVESVQMSSFVVFVYF